jgi:hypothetical protein
MGRGWPQGVGGEPPPAVADATSKVAGVQINIEDVQMSEQHRPDATSISIQQGVGFQKSTLFGKSLQAVRMMWQHIRTVSSISEYSRVPFERGKDFSEDRPDARSCRLDVNLRKIELRSF